MKNYILYLLILWLYPVDKLSDSQLFINKKSFEQNTTSYNKDCTVCKYWDGFIFTDSTNYGSKKKTTEIIFSKYIVQSQNLSYTEIISMDNHILSMSENNKKAFVYFWELYEKYYYDPDSPYRNDSLYINILSYIMNSSCFSEIYSNKAIYQWQLIHKNRVGCKAEDFSFTTLSGLKGNLYEIKNDYTILFFNIPDCEECIRTKKILESRINPINNVSIVAIYPNDDYLLWSKEKYPKKWINGYDKDLIILEKELYDLRAFPTIYLLDKDKTVLLKDPFLEELFSFFSLSNR